MPNKAYRQFVALTWLALALVVTLATACSPAETPPTAVPIVVELTAVPTAVLTGLGTPGGTPGTSPIPFQTAILPSPQPVASPTATPPTTPTSDVTPQVRVGQAATPGPTSLIREGDTLSSLSPLPSPTPGTVSAALGIPCVVGPGPLELRGGPDPSFTSFKSLPAGTTLAALKYTADGLWLLVETGQKEAGWVNAAGLSCRGDLSRLPVAEGVGTPAPTAATPLAAAPTPPPLPTATPTPPAPAPESWRGEYYDNLNLAGQPVLVRNDPALDFNWGPGSPAPEVPADNFSVRWTRSFEFAQEGDFRFLADVDDGVRLYLDGWLIIDEWNTNPYVLHSGVFADVKPGAHTITVEFFEAGGDAHVKVWFEQTTLAIASGDKWVGEYYNNPDFQGAPFVVREDDDIDFDWGGGAPISGMNDHHFSVRWQRSVKFEAGDYKFEAKLADDDQVKIFLDGWLVLDEYSEDGETVSDTFDDVGDGYHTIKVEYQEFSEGAGIEVNWERD